MNEALPRITRGGRAQEETLGGNVEGAQSVLIAAFCVKN